MKLLATILWCAAHLPGNLCAMDNATKVSPAYPPHPTVCGFTNIQRVEAPTGWSLISGSSVGKGTLIYSIGDDYKTLEECLKGWSDHKAETDRANEGVPRSPEYVTTAYCVDRRTSRRVDIQ
jgi:hypothetical protein